MLQLSKEMNQIWSEVARVFLEYGLGEKTAAEALAAIDAMSIPEQDQSRFTRARGRLESASEEATRRRDHDHAAMNALAAIVANTDLLRFALESMRTPAATDDERQTLALAREAVTRVQASSAELTGLLRERRAAGF